ncbi:MAG: hypothetical protein HPY60_05085 [Candidatus Methanofastidiosum sp.]|nr:hypothetical protein [Methanofastidiosum sp.]
MESLEILHNLCLHKDDDGIKKYLEDKSDDELLGILDSIVKESIFFYKIALIHLIDRLYSTNDSFIKILIELIEENICDYMINRIINPIKVIALRNYEITCEIIKKMQNMGRSPGVCSGIITSMLLGEGILDKEVTTNLVSEDCILQRNSLVAICSSDLDKFKIFFPNIIDNVENVHQENKDILIYCLVKGINLLNDESALIVLQKEIENADCNTALSFINYIRFREGFPIELIKKAVIIIEREYKNHPFIDDALGLIYKGDSKFVVDRLRTRLNEKSRYTLANEMLKLKIKEVGVTPVIRMFEEEIDKNNSRMIYFGERELNDFLGSGQDSIEWCEKWKGDERKESVVLRLLQDILTDLINYNPSDIRNRAISLVREFGVNKGLDYEDITKNINLGKDHNEGAKYKEDTLKALEVINHILYPLPRINVDTLKKNLEKYPYICKAIGKDWLIRNATSKKPHLLAHIYSSESKNNVYQLYWERVFKILDRYKIEINIKKLQDIENARFILAEAEVFSRLAPTFKINKEPDIKEFGRSKLEAKIEYNGQSALIEVATVEELLEFKVSGQISCIPGRKTKNILMGKFRKQLKNGKVDPGIPVIFILCLGADKDFLDVESAIYGILKANFVTNAETLEVVEEGLKREEGSFYKEEHSDIVTAVAAYTRDYYKSDSLVGRIFFPPNYIISKNPIGREFRLRLRDALFGKSENSDWQSLTKIKGINKEMARILHAQGIEDIEELAISKAEDFSIEGYGTDEIKEFQKEAMRVIQAISRGSIRYLKGIDKHTYDVLVNKKIYLISKLLELKEKPENIDSDIWIQIIEDAERITRNYENK